MTEAHDALEAVVPSPTEFVGAFMAMQCGLGLFMQQTGVPESVQRLLINASADKTADMMGLGDSLALIRTYMTDHPDGSETRRAILSRVVAGALDSGMSQDTADDFLRRGKGGG